jgi:hypothetical protein
VESIIPRKIQCKVAEVKYQNKELLHRDFEKYLSMIIYKTPKGVRFNPFNGYIIKRTEFDYEKECRFLLYNHMNLLANIPNKQSTFIYIDQTSIAYQTIIRDIYELPIDIPINKFIKSVMINPDSPDIFEKEIIDICHNYNIEYEGRSRLFHLQ